MAFVGAGFSAPVELPLWKPLLEKLVAGARREAQRNEARTVLLDYAAQCIAENQLSRAASAIQRADPGGVVNRQLAKFYDGRVFFTNRPSGDPRKKSMQARLDALNALPWAGVVTTNYDSLIEDSSTAWKNIVPTPTHNEALGRALKSGLRPFLVYLHGSTKHSEMVLTEEQYDHVYLGSATVRSFLRALFLRYTLVFIGTQVEDRFVEFKRELQLTFRNREGVLGGAALGPEYVLLPDSDIQRGSYLESTGGFKPIYYANATGHHEGLVKRLRQLSDELRAFRIGKTQMDDVNRRLAGIVRRGKDMNRLQIINEFWDGAEGNRLAGEWPDLNSRELGYRLFYLVYRKMIAFDEHHEVFRPLRK